MLLEDSSILAKTFTFKEQAYITTYGIFYPSPTPPM